MNLKLVKLTEFKRVKIIKDFTIYLISEMQKFSLNVQTYEHKKTENEMVKKELLLLDEEDIVYKLVGPILVKEDTAEARMNVDKRLEFINKEM